MKFKHFIYKMYSKLIVEVFDLNAAYMDWISN